MMLKLAVDAGIPIIAAYTRDLVNLPYVLEHVTDHKWQTDGMQIKHGSKILLALSRAMKQPMPAVDDLYPKLMANEATLLVVNPPVLTEAMFDAGEVPVPKDKIQYDLGSIVGDLTKAVVLMQALGGVTIKEATELALLTMARDKSLTMGGLMRSRREAFQEQAGLTLVDSKQVFYQPHEDLEKWLFREKNVFLHEKDWRLVPRGLMLDGVPGTGKTSGAKFIAEVFGVPLYRLDVGASKSMWVGESERIWRENLSRIDREEPCVCLWDEVEKVFAKGVGGDSGTTTSMMSYALWWLAEHRKRVLTVMTTNDVKKLPRELWRERRIDRKFVFEGLQQKDAIDFVKHVAATFPERTKHWNLIRYGAIAGEVMAASGSGTPPRVTQAALTEGVYEAIKKESKT